MILVLGSTGMLGHKVLAELKRHFEDVETFDRKDGFDPTNPNGYEHYIKSLKPKVIVNCVGLIKHREESIDSEASIAINSLFPHRLQKIQKGWGGRLIHFSTDCVFSGRRGSYYEVDESDALDLYGKSKFLGEVSGYHNALTLRTSIIGRELSNRLGLLEWLLQQQGTVKGYTEVKWSGVTTDWLARTVADLIEKHQDLYGLYQVTSDHLINKYKLLCMLKDHYDLDIEIVPDSSIVCNRSMIGTKFEDATGIVRPTYHELIAELERE